ncbi:hypothetical protein D9M73_262130 [compost metagenome]
MMPIDVHFTHANGTHHKVIRAQTSMVMLAIHLPLRLTAPCACQSRIDGPKRGCVTSQSCRRLEPREAAQAEISTNTVVGRPGTKMPTMPTPRLT